MIFKNIDWKYTVLIIVLVLLGFFGHLFRTEILEGLKAFFELKELTLFAGGLAIIFTITHKLKTKKIRFNSSMSFNEFRRPFEEVLSFLSNPVTIVCSISLAKGLFLQTTNGVKYFPLFGTMELTFVGLVTAYLLYISVMELIRNMKETMLQVSISEKKARAIPENEVKEKVPEPK